MSVGIRILHFRAENVKRLEVVEFEPDRLVNVVAGDNGAGKSAVLDSILYALGGKKAMPSEPVRRGAEEAKITLDLGDFTVERRITQKGRDYLTIKTREGLRFSSPQRMLDGLMAKISFDPSQWLRKSPKEQRAELLAIAPLGINYDGNRADYKARYESRTEVGRDLKRVEGALGQHADLEPLPEGLRPIGEVWADHERGSAALVKREKAEAALRGLDGVIEKAERECHDLQVEYERQLAARREAIARANEERKAKAAELECLPEPPDLEAIREEFSRAQEAAQLSKRHEEVARLKAERVGYQVERDKLTAELKSLDLELEQALKQSQMPVEGLAVGEAEVLFSGLPLDQASQAEQLRVALAIATAVQEAKDGQHLKVVRIMDGSLLDESSMAQVRTFAQDHDLQLWIERVERAGATIVIEDGCIELPAEKNQSGEVGRPRHAEGGEGPA